MVVYLFVKLVAGPAIMVACCFLCKLGNRQKVLLPSGRDVEGLWFESRRSVLQAAVYLFVKLVAVPAIMVGCCFLCKLDNPTARGSVLIAALPISEAAFAVTQVGCCIS